MANLLLATANFEPYVKDSMCSNSFNTSTTAVHIYIGSLIKQSFSFPNKLKLYPLWKTDPFRTRSIPKLYIFPTVLEEKNEYMNKYSRVLWVCNVKTLFSSFIDYDLIMSSCIQAQLKTVLW